MIFFGNNLRVLRTRNGHTQEDMERLLGISKNTWSNYENSKSEPSIEGLQQISNFFGVTLDQLILQNLDDNDKHVPKRPRPYAKNNKSGKVNESEIKYLKKEFKKLGKRFDSLIKSQSEKKSG